MQSKTLFAVLLILFAVFIGLSLAGINTFYSLDVITLEITSGVLSILTAFMLLRSSSVQSQMATMPMRR